MQTIPLSNIMSWCQVSPYVEHKHKVKAVLISAHETIPVVMINDLQQQTF